MTTDQNGLFRFQELLQGPVLILASHNGQQLATESDTYLYGGGRAAESFEQVVLFTDRSLYRPGQTIQVAAGHFYERLHPASSWRSLHSWRFPVFGVGMRLLDMVG